MGTLLEGTRAACLVVVGIQLVVVLASPLVVSSLVVVLASHLVVSTLVVVLSSPLVGVTQVPCLLVVDIRLLVLLASLLLVGATSLVVALFKGLGPGPGGCKSSLHNASCTPQR